MRGHISPKWLKLKDWQTTPGIDKDKSQLELCYTAGEGENW